MKNKLINYSPLLLLGTFVLGSFLFIENNFKYWYAFMEQYLMFQTTEIYFFEKLAEPGGLTQYVTEFISIAFVHPYGASITIALLLGILAGCFYSYLKACKLQPSMLVAILPAFLFWIFPQESIAPLLTAIIATISAILYTLIKSTYLRYIWGFFLLTLSYFTSAPAPLLASVLMAIYECSLPNNKQRWLWASLLVFYSGILPLIAMRTCYVIPMLEAFLSKHLYHPEFPAPTSLLWIVLSFPLITLFSIWKKNKTVLTNKVWNIVLAEALLLMGIAVGIVYKKDTLEQAYRYDYHVRRGEWQEIVNHAKIHSVQDMNALVYLNLALSYTNQFTENFLQFPQKGEEGFIPFDPHTRLGLIQASEVAWQVSQVNAAQRFAFVGVLSSERLVQPRLMKRLVETYLVTGEYRAAEKYIKLLEATPHYKDWAKAQRPLLNPSVCESTEWIAKKRAMLPITDNPFDLTKTLPSALAFLIDDHPDNRAAFEYGMGYLLAHKDLNTFMHYMQLMKERGETFPTRYQEAICLFYSAMVKDPNAFNSYPIKPEIKNRFLQFLQSTRKFHPEALKRQYGDTYYYYMQYGPNLTEK